MPVARSVAMAGAVRAESFDAVNANERLEGVSATFVRCLEREMDALKQKIGRIVVEVESEQTRAIEKNHSRAAGCLGMKTRESASIILQHCFFYGCFCELVDLSQAVHAQEPGMKKLAALREIFFGAETDRQ